MRNIVQTNTVEELKILFKYCTGTQNIVQTNTVEELKIFFRQIL
jgi:hypothetical protein